MEDRMMIIMKRRAMDILEKRMKDVLNADDLKELSEAMYNVQDAEEESFRNDLDVLSTTQANFSKAKNSFFNLVNELISRDIL